MTRAQLSYRLSRRSAGIKDPWREYLWEPGLPAMKLTRFVLKPRRLHRGQAWLLQFSCQRLIPTLIRAG
ncbi:hypothetical protein QZH47_05350 [Pseudomonas corrugata]